MPVLRLPETTLNYLQMDERPDPTAPPLDLVLVHGLAANLAFWYHLAPALAAQYRVTMVDLRGHGRSGMPATGYTPAVLAQDVLALLDHLGLERVHLLGHSFGGSVCLHLALAHPERLASLLLADVRLRLLQPQQRVQDWPHWERLGPNLKELGIHIDEAGHEAGYQLLEEVMRFQLRGSDASVFPKLLAQWLPIGGGKRTAQHWIKLLDTTSARQDFIALEDFTQTDLAQLTLPLLAVYGEQSMAVKTARQLQELWTQARFEFIPQAGHFFPLSQPEKFVMSIQNFLNTPCPSARTAV
ncbi:alpha/beta fold hydrolase [Candidatus Cyanaurora vandensis]|uniref:alpha/beta fold hydrolase n=1 Tax=Candidatus Cyanaurora vandensis TaxID=2714958 RepID=UPI002579ECE3|nr:alpha/beta hydrolase [Candidatus Cyanaurora vandensis]